MLTRMLLAKAYIPVRKVRNTAKAKASPKLGMDSTSDLGIDVGSNLLYANH